jgi:hypothetical protein
MEFTCHCSGTSWRLRLTAHDAESARWLTAMFETAGQALPVPQRVEPLLWLFEDSLHREHATDADPLLDVHLRQDGPLAEAWVTLDGLETRLHNRASPSPDPVLGDLVRVATPEETLELAIRWFLAHEHLGCREPEELCMWGTLTTATAYVVDDVKGWLAARTPLPGVEPGTKGLAVFLARMGTFSDVQAAMDSIEARYHPEVIGQGVYGGDEPRMLVTVGRVATAVVGQHSDDWAGRGDCREGSGP